jgi:hypothetical protein
VNSLLETEKLRKAKRRAPPPTEAELQSVALVREVTSVWEYCDDAEKLKMVRLLAYLASATYPASGTPNGQQPP